MPCRGNAPLCPALLEQIEGGPVVVVDVELCALQALPPPVGDDIILVVLFLTGSAGVAETGLYQFFELTLGCCIWAEFQPL